MYLKRKIGQCHKLLLVLGGYQALTCSYSERWQVARIGLCGRGAVCRALPKYNFYYFYFFSMYKYFFSQGRDYNRSAYNNEAMENI